MPKGVAPFHVYIHTCWNKHYCTCISENTSKAASIVNRYLIIMC